MFGTLEHLYKAKSKTIKLRFPQTLTQDLEDFNETLSANDQSSASSGSDNEDDSRQSPPPPPPPPVDHKATHNTIDETIGEVTIATSTEPVIPDDSTIKEKTIGEETIATSAEPVIPDDSIIEVTSQKQTKS
jgi:hypothetical protein